MPAVTSVMTHSSTQMGTRPSSSSRPEESDWASEGRGFASQDVKPLAFSDIDGTLMHELGPNEIAHRLSSQPGSVLVTPPSATGRTGVISAGTLRRIASLRAEGVRFVLVTGARLSTLLMRLPFLPAADAYVCESGGIILYPGDEDSVPTAAPMEPDVEWRATLNDVIGPAANEALPPTERQGELWDWLRSMTTDGFSVDSGYATSFRVYCKNGKTEEDIKAAAKSAPPSLQCSFNMGRADFYPAVAGKLGAAKYLMARFGATPATSTFLCDDDNDMELAAAVSKAFLPSISADSVTAAVRAHPEHFAQSRKEDTAASEKMLDAVAAHYGLPAFAAGR